MLGDGGGDLVAVAALGDDLEAVVGSEDAGDAGAHDGLVVDDDDADHDRDQLVARRGEDRQAGLDAPAVGRRPGLELPPSARARSAMPTRPKCPALGSGGGAGRPRSATVRRTPSPLDVGDQLDGVAGGVAGDVGQRLPGDPVERRADRAGEIGHSRRDRRRDGEPGAAVVLDEGGEVGDPASAGRCRARRCAARRPWRGSGRGSPARRSRRRRAPARPRRGRGAARGGHR